MVHKACMLQGLSVQKQRLKPVNPCLGSSPVLTGRSSTLEATMCGMHPTSSSPMGFLTPGR